VPSSILFRKTTPTVSFKSVFSNTAISTSLVFTNPAVGKLISVNCVVRIGNIFAFV